MHANDSMHASPLSPKERDMTAEMHNEEVPPQQHNAAFTGIPQNTSSWEILDIVAIASASHDDAALPLQVVVDSNRTEEEAALACGVEHEGQRTEGVATAAMTAAVVGMAGAPPSGRASPVRTASSGWSLVSTPSETHLVCAATTVPPYIALPSTPNSVASPQSHNVDAHTGVAVVSALHPGHLVASQTISMASPPPSPVPQLTRGARSTGEGWSATSYEEVCLSGTLHPGNLNTRLVSTVVSTCTTPSPRHRAGCVAPESTERRSLDGREGDSLGSTTCVPAPACFVDTGRQAAGEAATSSDVSHTPTPAQLVSWLANVRTALHPTTLHHPSCPPSSPSSAEAEATKGTSGAAAATWSARRVSFLSSSVMAVALSTTGLPHTTFPSFSDVPPPPLPSRASTGLASSSSSSPSPPTSHPAAAAFSNTLTAEAAQWWSRTRVVCADGSQQAIRGLHRLCAYVWADLKNHWYPQLRLVLGDHSCAGKTRRVRSARRRRGKQSKAEERRGSAEVPRWRSVSAPCLVSAELRSPQEVRRTLAGGTWTGNALRRDAEDCCSTRSSLRGSLHVCYTLTADAVASAAQGLLVFFL